MAVTRRIFRLFVAPAAALVLAAPSAGAYCRATPCDPASGTCKTDKHDCSTEGPDLSWPQGKLRLSVAAGGSVLRGISGDDAVGAVSDALGAWAAATCDGGEHPALHVKVASVAADVMAAFDMDGGPNENDVLFRDAVWPYEKAAVAKTTLGMDLDTGELLDADIQLDSELYDLALNDDAGAIDVVAVLTHEIGHVLGLGHSDVPGATMQPETTGFGTAELRSLEPDDMAGICAIYPPGSDKAAPATPSSSDPGSSSSGCSIATRRPASSLAGFILLGVSLAGVRRRRHAPRRR